MTALERAIASPAPVTGFGARSPLDGLHRGSVGAADVLAQSVSAVAPSAAATTVIGLSAAIAGGGTVWAIAAAGIVALLVALTLTPFARRLASTGSLYTYAAHGFGRRAAFATGGAIVLGYGAISVFALLGGAHSAAILFDRVMPGGSASASIAIVLAVESAVLAIVLWWGIRLSTRLALVAEIIAVVIVAALLVALCVAIGPVDIALVLPADAPPARIAAGAVLALTAFVGVESASTLGVEARTPLRTIPRAIVGTVVVAGLLYVLAAWTQVAGFAAQGRDLAAATSPVDTLAAAYGLGGWAPLVDAGIALSFLACAVASTTALTRVLFAMGRDGALPSSFGRTHPVRRTPDIAVALALAVVVGIPVVLLVLGVDIWAAASAALVVAAAGYIVAYAIVCAALPSFLRGIGELTVGAVLLGVASSTLLTAGLLVYLAVEGAAGNPGAAIAVVLVGAVVVASLWRARRTGAAVGAYDEPVAAQVLGGVAQGNRGD